MPSKTENKFVIYPEYFDAKLSKSEGRKIPKKLAIQDPNVETIEAIAKKMNLNPLIEDKHYSKNWFEKRKRVVIDKKGKKLELIKKIAEELKK